MLKNIHNRNVKYFVIVLVFVFGILKNLDFKEIKTDIVNGYIDGYNDANFK